MQSQIGGTMSSTEQAIHGERSRLAGELHDVIAQNFQYILLQLEAARGVLGPEWRWPAGMSSWPRNGLKNAGMKCATAFTR